MIKSLPRAFKIFFHPKSPAAVYHNPRRLLNNVLAYLLNLYLGFANTINPGDTVRCNICGWTGSKFGYLAAVSVDCFVSHEICLGCQSNHRTRALVDLFAQNVNLTANDMTIIDVGAASSTRRFFERYPNIKYLVLDRYKEADISSDIIDIQLPGNSVEGILCCHILEHIDDYRGGMEELFRVLKPDHYGVIAVPQTPGLKKSRQTNQGTYLGYGHIWEFGDDFAEQLADVGFQVTTVDVFINDKHRHFGTMPFHVVLKPRAAI